MPDFERLREQMVDRQIEARGVRTPAVLDAMRSVPRDAFVSDSMKALAYDDSPLPIGHGQTISQPYIVAYMVDALELEGGEKVLDIGTGCGYAAAVLGEIAEQVFSIELVEELADSARATLEGLGYDNVTVIQGDGTLGLPDEAPFDAIVVAAGGPDVPGTLKEQLAIGGRLVIPVGVSRSLQELVRVTRVAEDEYVTDDLTTVRFVPLIGEQGWTTP